LDYENGIISLEVSCSKGTYIRSLIADIGDKLGCGAHVIELRRTGFAHVDIAQTIKFAELEALVGDDFAQLDAKIFKSRPIRNKNCLWWPCLLMDRDKMSKLYREPSIDAS
jgi:tRNA pseudouridine55 synthase